MAVALANVVAPDNPTPDQEYVTPVAGPPVNTVEVVAQVKVPPVADADGVVVFCVTDTLPVVKHPFAVLVTV